MMILPSQAPANEPIQDFQHLPWIAVPYPGGLRGLCFHAFLFRDGAMVSDGCHRVADQAMEMIRRILSMPSPEHELWRSISQNQRIVLLMAAGLPDDRADDSWNRFSREDQVSICLQIEAFGRIAKKLHTIRKG